MNLKFWTALKNICMAVVALVAVFLAIGNIVGIELGAAGINALLVLEMLALALWLLASMKVVIAKTSQNGGKGGKK